MNIALMQMPDAVNIEQTQTKNIDRLGAFGSNFGAVLNNAMQSTTIEQSPVMPSAVAQDTLDVIQTTQVKELFDLLDIELDSSERFAVIEGEVVALDEMLNLEDLTAALGLTVEEVQVMMQQLTDEPIHTTEDVFELMEQLQALVPQMMVALQGEHKVTPKEAKQLVEIMKMVELLGAKSDLNYMQVAKVDEIKALLQVMQQQVQQVTDTVTVTDTKVMTFQQVMQQVTKTEVETAIVAPQQQTVETKTVVVQLPQAKPAQPETLLKEIQQLINRSQLAGSQGQIKLMLKLFPENLGQIRIEITQQNGVLTARLLASTAAGKELLDGNLNQLKTAFVAQNIQMERIDVAQSLQDPDRGMRDQNMFNNFFRQQNEQEDSEQVEEDEETKSFSDYLTEEVYV